MKKALIYIGITIVLIVVGFSTGQKFMEVSISKLNMNDISLSWTTLSGQFTQTLIFIIAIGLIPLLEFISSKIAGVNSIQQKIGILATIIVSGIIFWQFRLFQLNGLFEKYRVNGIENFYYWEDLKIGHYLSMGFLIGAVIITLVFIKMNKRKSTLANKS